MIEARGLTKHHGNFTAVKAVSFTVAPGEVVGLLGPNGAGKTTLLRMLAGVLTPSEGEGVVAGASTATDSLGIKPVHVLVAAVLGVVLGQATLRTRSLLGGVLLHFTNNAASVLLSRLETPPAWLDSWPLSLALCLPGVVALWLLRGEAPAPALAARPPGAAAAS